VVAQRPWLEENPTQSGNKSFKCNTFVLSVILSVIKRVYGQGETYVYSKK
tara:strand:- start:14278 stop:14427 length:150 start_codon:yes stop_codon:yes gene_type:complete